MRRAYLLSFLLATVLGLGASVLAQTPASAVSSADTPSAAASAQPTVEERLQAFELKLQQLEKRVDAATTHTPAADAPAPNEAAASEDRFEALDQKLRVLERERELDQENATAKSKEAPLVSAGSDGFSITSADKSFRLKVGGYAQVDGRTFYGDPTHSLNGGFTLRRARLRLDGTVGKYVDFRLSPEFGNGTIALYDAFADVKFQPYSVFRGGKFKSPLGLEVLQEDTELSLIERSLVSDLLPSRDIGFEVWGKLGNRFTYQTAILNGAPDASNTTDADINRGRDVVGRVFFTPFAKSGPKVLDGLGFGLGVSTGHENGAAALAGLKTSSGQNTFFSYVAAAQANGNRIRYSPQLYYYTGPFGVLAEYAEENERLTSGLVTRDLSNHAWQVTGSWVITGEKKSYGRVAPKNRLDESGTQRRPFIGAWEIAGRYSELNVDPTAFTGNLFADPTKSAEAARAWAVGLNWYLNKNVKFASNYENTDFEKGAVAAGVVKNRPTEKVFLQRLQVVF